MSDSIAVKEQPPGNGAGGQGEEPVRRLDGQQVKMLFEAAASWLENHAQTINALNVFPVPDGDTGTNMLMTMRSAVQNVADHTGRSAAETVQRVAQGAIRGARGNSGVILSQILRGFANASQEREYLTTDDIARAFRRASENAYGAVLKPVEGTILTVARAVADAAEEAAAETSDIREQLGRIVSAAHTALERTPEMLPILKEAGVVDSGGQGLVTLLQGMVRHLRGESTAGEGNVPAAAVGPAAIDANVHLDEPPPFLAEGRYGYDIQYLIQGQDLDVEGIRRQVNELGDCPLVVGDSSLVKVHVHALSPGPALDLGASLGMLDDVVVENLDLQYESFAAQHAGPGEGARELTTEDVTGVGIVAVAAGPGLEAIFRAMGASAVVRGGQTMNPSTEELLAAIEGVDAGSVIVLPNNKNIVMAARQAAELCERPVYVVPTRSAPQGFAALMAFDYSADAAANAEGMAEAMTHPRTVEITRAVRTTTINGIGVEEGDTIGLLDGELVARGSEDAPVAAAVLDAVDLESYEIVTVYHGAERSESAARELCGELARAHPELEFDVQAGGQPHYAYIFAIE